MKLEEIIKIGKQLESEKVTIPKKYKDETIKVKVNKLKDEVIKV